MITLQDLDRIVPDLIEQLKAIHRSMSKYKKLNTDFRGITLMREIEAKISQIKKVHEAYRSTPSYRTKDFSNWVRLQEQYIAKSRQIHDRIKEYEGVVGYS